MKNKFLLMFTLFILISIPINNSFSQQFYKTFEVPGGGSGTPNSSSVDSNDDYILYIVGGAVVAGIVIYSLLKDKKGKSKEDTTAVILDDGFINRSLALNEKVLNLQSQIPINISFGLQSDRVIKEQKRYFLGFSCRF